jgi:diacylglycerol kinase family enzyme
MDVSTPGTSDAAPADRPRDAPPKAVVRDGVLFVNPSSGPNGSLGLDEVAEAFSPHGLTVEEVEDPARLPDLVRTALAESRAPVGVSGGDGTIRCAAECLAGTGVPLLVVPGGTRNHFARELGIESVDDAIDALDAGTPVALSVGVVGDRIFVNNASIGLYPALVRRRDHLGPTRFKAVASLRAAAALIRRGRPLHVTVNGTRILAWLVFVGNGRYGEGFTDIVERDLMNAEVLDVRVVRADRRLARLRVVISFLAGRIAQSHLVVAGEAQSVSIDVPFPRVDVALDGEVVSLEAPLEFSVRPEALTVLVADPKATLADRSGAKHVSEPAAWPQPGGT